MKQFKANWQIQKNWQLIFPLLGILALVYSSFKITNSLLKNVHIAISIVSTVVISFILLKFCLFLFKKLEGRWAVDYKWEIIRIFLVFALTGSSSVYVGKPIMKAAGITKENLNVFVYWVLYIIIGFIFYQVFLVLLGWLLGQFKFFWEFEKKMIRRLGLGVFLK